MSVKSIVNPNLVDVIKRTAPDGSVETDIAELMNIKTEGFFDFMSMVECNDGSSHKTTIRTGLPTTYWRKYYKGVPSSKSQTEQVRETTGMLRAKNDIDYELLQQETDKDAYRLTEDVAFIESMGQAYLDAMINANEATDPEKFQGLGPRYTRLDSNTPNGDDIPYTSQNVIGGGGSTNLGSVWLIVSSPRTIAGLYPKGSMAGLDRSIETEPRWIKDAAGDEFQVVSSYYKWNCGLMVKDWRYAVRIANVDSAMSSSADLKALVTNMSKAIERVEDLSAGRAFFMTTRKIREKIRLGIEEKALYGLTLEKYMANVPVPSFYNIPIFRSDTLKNTETALT